ncbi:MAG TPA: hypothetical protein VFM18_10545 [Methanosarcina sp.]|nr:hypothetical protein [Methanosarcina sp.]
MNQIVTLFYAVMGFVSILTYIPTIYVMYNVIDESDSSIFSWVLWWLSSIAGVLYGSVVTKDFTFTMISLGHFLGTSVIILIQLYKRK